MAPLVKPPTTDLGLARLGLQAVGGGLVALLQAHADLVTGSHRDTLCKGQTLDSQLAQVLSASRGDKADILKTRRIFKVRRIFSDLAARPEDRLDPLGQPRVSEAGSQVNGPAQGEGD